MSPEPSPTPSVLRPNSPTVSHRDITRRGVEETIYLGRKHVEPECAQTPRRGDSRRSYPPPPNVPAPRRANWPTA